MSAPNMHILSIRGPKDSGHSNDHSEERQDTENIASVNDHDVLPSSPEYAIKRPPNRKPSSASSTSSASENKHAYAVQQLTFRLKSTAPSKAPSTTQMAIGQAELSQALREACNDHGTPDVSPQELQLLRMSMRHVWSKARSQHLLYEGSSERDAVNTLAAEMELLAEEWTQRGASQLADEKNLLGALQEGSEVLAALRAGELRLDERELKHRLQRAISALMVKTISNTGHSRSNANDGQPNSNPSSNNRQHPPALPPRHYAASLADARIAHFIHNVNMHWEFFAMRPDAWLRWIAPSLEAMAYTADYDLGVEDGAFRACVNTIHEKVERLTEWMVRWGAWKDEGKVEETEGLAATVLEACGEIGRQGGWAVARGTGKVK